jgi:hypothetical protein
MPAFRQQSGTFSSPLPTASLQGHNVLNIDENAHMRIHEDEPGSIESLKAVKHVDFQDDDGRSTRSGPRRSDVSRRTVSPVPESILSGDFQYTPHRERPGVRVSSDVKAMHLSPSPPGSIKAGRILGSDRKWSTRAVKRSDLSSMDSDDGMEHTEEYTASLGDLGSGSIHGSSPLFRRDVDSRRMEDHHRRHHVRDISSRTDTSMSRTHRDITNPPLVLLHVSILPSHLPNYSNTVLEATKAPKWLIDNMMVLREKLCSAVLARGILIPHPGEEYDVLEERLLEALELCAPRVLGCGHFYDGEGTYDYQDDTYEVHHDDDDEYVDVDDSLTETGEVKPRAICDSAYLEDKRMQANEDEEEVCDTCSQHMRLPNRGAGFGNRRWDVRFFASNGLMRAGAWSAAWREMERVDVEIQPWMPHELKMGLDTALEKEMKQNQAKAIEADKIREAEIAKMEAHERVRELESRLHRSQEEAAALLQEAVALKQNQQQKRPAKVPEPIIQMKKAREAQHQSRQTSGPFTPTTESLAKDIPLEHLIKNYISVLIQDKRNVAMAVLGFLVVLLLSLFMASSNTTRSVQVSPLAQLPSCTVPTGIPAISDTNLLAEKNINIQVPSGQSADSGITRPLSSYAGVSQTGNIMGSTASVV